MRENYSLREESNKQTAKNTTCTLSKGYTITIPKLIRETLNLYCGHEIIIRLQSKELVIQKLLYEDTLENKMVLNNRGSVRIPQEFIKLLSLERGDIFNLYLTNSGILLKKSAKAYSHPILA
ncbi:AbrB/MazE/SpoVT family DNA-binding domain-containing protein [Oceanobacillus saliphilus]|uniref:AbrB/MazE/SpoVT family DNA-binding domain-containing protein n=1 Tax=Oceanobacillus saliphilus TaxID=2925834 RepID=UPI00201D5B3F|nr:AbrB/MazE/SpoVT family DNA-binding domain-containing protein [Oceanobacillus saliphilus]